MAETTHRETAQIYAFATHIVAMPKLSFTAAHFRFVEIEPLCQSCEQASQSTHSPFDVLLHHTLPTSPFDMPAPGIGFGRSALPLLKFGAPI